MNHIDHAVEHKDSGTVINYNFYRDVIRGMARTQKTIPAKYLYDKNGSRIFEQICNLPEYYPTRTEISIMAKNLPAMAELIGPEARIIEFGTGEGLKTNMLLNQLESPAVFVPIDISRSALNEASAKLENDFPQLVVNPICADYANPSLFDKLEKRKPFHVFFPGSSLGNFDYEDALQFLSHLRRIAGKTGGILVGIDLLKDPELLVPAYNDSAGVTAEFNLNLLRRINNELHGNFDLSAFAHYAMFNPSRKRVEMHLISLRNQQVRIMGRMYQFFAGETIHTENSYKYTVETFRELASLAGLELKQTWMDERCMFSMHYLKAAYAE